MALVKKSVGFARGEVILHDDGTFKTAYGWKRRGIWDDVLNEWAEPPYEEFEGKEVSLQQLKNFVANLQPGPETPAAASSEVDLE